MRRKTILIGAVILAGIAFTSCGEKEEMSIENDDVSIVIDNDETRDALSMYDNEFNVEAQLIPDGLGDSIDIKISSNADPEGFTTSVSLRDKSYEDGKVIYLYKYFMKSFSVAMFTDADRRLIKVDSQDDVVTIDIGDGIYTEQISFDAEANVALTYWPEYEENLIEATCFVYEYDFDGSQNPSVEVWTSYDDTKVNYTLEWNDPSQYNGLPEFNDYTIDLDFAVGSSTGNGKIGAVDGSTVYIKYNGVTYVSQFNEDTHSKLPVQ